MYLDLILILICMKNSIEFSKFEKNWIHHKYKSKIDLAAINLFLNDKVVHKPGQHHSFAQASPAQDA